MPINYNQQTNPNLDYQGLLEQFGRDREFINNYQQVEPSNRYKRMLQQELAYQAKDNGVSDEKLALMENAKLDYSDPNNNKELINAYQKAILDAQKEQAKQENDNIYDLGKIFRESRENRLRMFKNGEIPYSSNYGNSDISASFNTTKRHQTNAETNQNIQITYNALIKAGYSDNQAKHLLEEIGRENGFQTSLLLGTHSDPANRATNMGLVSWQGERRTALINHLKKDGVMDSSGKWIANKQAIIESQARFMRQEMNKYKRTVKEFLNNPDVDRATSIRTLGEDYIAWRIKDPQYRAIGLNTMSKWRNTIPRVLGS